MPEIKYFGEVAEKTGKAAEQIGGEVTVSGLKQWLEQTHRLDLTGLKLAVNHKLVDWNNNLEISETDQVAILSPFAGG